MKQTTFAALAWSSKGKVTRRERFLAEMNAVISWARLLGLIEPYYPKAGKGTQPLPMERMLRICEFDGPRKDRQVVCTVLADE